MVNDAGPNPSADDEGVLVGDADLGATSLVIAIDGPAGAGKSSVGHAVADRLGVEYLDTGAMYRAMTFAAIERGIDVADVVAVANMAPSVRIDMAAGTVIVDGVDATAAIRGAAVTERVSEVAANSAVRAELVGRQRAWVAERGGAVVEGRDIGSVVFPDATLKLFITASARTRAQRRVAQVGGDVDAVERSIIERDRRDSERGDSPLTMTPDMVEVDTTDLPIEAVVAAIIDMVPADLAPPNPLDPPRHRNDPRPNDAGPDGPGPNNEVGR